MAEGRLSGLYAITPSPADGLKEMVRAALEGGARIVQYREKGGGADRRLAEARSLRVLCHRHGALFIVNDDPHLARAAAADGVHLGQGDTPVVMARSLLGPAAVIGVTCHDRIDLALRARSEGADYIAFGAFFPSATKPGASTAPLDLITRAREEVGIPICAIGGITAKNATAPVAAGADMIAVSAGLFATGDIEATARRLSTLF